MALKIFIFFYFLVFNIFYNLSFSDFDQNEEENKISIILGKGDQLNYESNGFIWSPKFKYSSFAKLDIGKGYNVKFNYGLKFDKFGIKLDSTNLNFDFHKLNLVVGIYRNIISQTRVAGMTYLIKPCNYFNFFFGIEMHRRTKYLLDKNNVEEWKERKYGTELKDFVTTNEEGKNDFPIRYGRFSQVPWSPNYSAGIILKNKNDKINFCLGGIFAPFLLYAYEGFVQTARKMHLSVRFLLKNIIHGWLDKLEISLFYNNALGEYSKYHNPQKFKINGKDFILPVSFVFSENNNWKLEFKKFGANIKTAHNITKNISFSFNISFLHYLEQENIISMYLIYNEKQEIGNLLVNNVFYTNLDFKWNIPRVRFIQLSGSIGFGILNNYDENLKPIFSLKNGELFWNARIGFGILIDELIQRESFDVFVKKSKDFNILDVLNIENINCGLKINQIMDYGRNPYEYYRRGFSHPLKLHPYCDITFIANSKNKIVLELCGNFNNKMGHGWEKENWIFKCVDKINFKWEYDRLLTIFAGFGESVVNDFTKVWRLGIKHKISKIVSWKMDIEKPRKSWKIQREISMINEDIIEDNTPQKCLLDINDYKNCDDGFLTGLKHPGFSFSFNFNFKKDIFMKIGTMWKPFNENQDGMTDSYDRVKGIVYFETKIKGFSFKCTLNRAAGCYTQIENCNINCHGIGFIPTEFCIAPDCYYQNSIFIKNTKKFIDKNALPKNRGDNFIYQKNNNPYLPNPQEKKLKYIITIDFQLMYSFKILKKRKDTIFLRLNYLHCFTKYDRVIMFLEKEEDIGNVTLKKFYENNFFKGGVRDDLIYLVLGTNIFIKPFLKVFVEFSFGFLHGLFNKDKNNIIQQCKKCPNSIKTQGINISKICFPIIIWNCRNSLWGVKIGFECDLGKKYCSNKFQNSL